MQWWVVLLVRWSLHSILQCLLLGLVSVYNFIHHVSGIAAALMNGHPGITCLVFGNSAMSTKFWFDTLLFRRYSPLRQCFVEIFSLTKCHLTKCRSLVLTKLNTDSGEPSVRRMGGGGVVGLRTTSYVS